MRRIILKKVLKTILLFTVIVLLALPLTACRESLVITKIIYDQKMKEKDEEKQVVRNDTDSEKEDEELPDLRHSETDRTEKQKRIANARGTQPNTGQAPRTVHDPASSNKTKADEKGNQQGNQSDKNKKSNPKTGKNGKSKSKPSEGDGGQGEKRQIYDDSGKPIDLPEKVNAVVAPGSAGIIVQMLGGHNILAGTSAGLLGDPLFQSVFGDEILPAPEGTQAYWSGAGNTPMSTGDFSNLIANKPDVCVSCGGAASFSSGQIASLNKNGIAYVTLPALDSAEHIEKAVSIVGNMIGDRRKEPGGVNAKALARDYASYCSNLMRDVSGAAGSPDGRYTLYVAGWDPAATFTIPDYGITESGMAWTSPPSARPVGEFLRTGGVTDNAETYSMPNTGAYAIIPVNINTEDNVQVTNGLSMLRKTDNNSFVMNSSYYLGQARFKNVIADSGYTKSCIEYSQNSNGIWKNFGRVTADVGGTSVTDYGMLIGDHIVRTNIRGNYHVLVNPYGVGSWAEGSPESVLECKWAAWKITGAYSESDVRDEIRNFYSTFYRHDLSDDQITAILNGLE